LVGLLGQVISLSQGFTYTRQYNIETQRQTTMPQAGFKPMIPVTKWPKPTPQTMQPLGLALNALFLIIIKTIISLQSFRFCNS
jgi:hypothetical protein